ncbi:DUF1269 domain-containing protein [Shewanella oneidensis]|nr:DUF1269 domain-containing protein [Shewanella oneidensis]MDX5997831.1 DUF1269 domain-containing protein [Shewanella oneidensis]MEE2027893.1 hypothetical protein [Shewanella oneidensis]
MKNYVAALFSSHDQAESGIRALQKGGFDMQELSIVGRDYHTEEQPLAYFNTGERIKFFGKVGATWGALVGMLLGSALIFIPVFGHIVVLGPLVTTLAAGIQGAVVGGGVSALFGALTAIGIPKDSIIRYETAIKADKFLVIVHSSIGEQSYARDLLSQAGGTDIESNPIALL